MPVYSAVLYSPVAKRIILSAKENGVEYVNNEVVSIEKNSRGNYVETITLKSGEKINAGQVVNATGPRASLTARMLGIQLPVEPRKRYTFILMLKSLLTETYHLPLTRLEFT